MKVHYYFSCKDFLRCFSVAQNIYLTAESTCPDMSETIGQVKAQLHSSNYILCTFNCRDVPGGQVLTITMCSVCWCYWIYSTRAVHTLVSNYPCWVLMMSSHGHRIHHTILLSKFPYSIFFASSCFKYLISIYSLLKGFQKFREFKPRNFRDWVKIS